MIVLDFIALHDQRLVRDATADVPLWARLRSAAARSKTLAIFPPGCRARCSTITRRSCARASLRST